MLDLSAAFDTLDHDLLLIRLKKLGISGIVLSWFSSYLRCRKQIVALNGNVLSGPRDSNVGVPKGSVLGPVLFSIYTLPLNQICEENDIFAGFYADDSQLYLLCKLCYFPDCHQQIESCVLNIQNWMFSNKLQVNDDKTELTMFASPRLCKELPRCNLVLEMIG